jgi:hypothetical protein
MQTQEIKMAEYQGQLMQGYQFYLNTLSCNYLFRIVFFIPFCC